MPSAHETEEGAGASKDFACESAAHCAIVQNGEAVFLAASIGAGHFYQGPAIPARPFDPHST